MTANVGKLVLWSRFGHSSDAMTKYYSYVHHDHKKEGVLRVFDPAELGTSSRIARSKKQKSVA
jgi:hypothetical protein